MFPIRWNFPFRKKDGTIVNIVDAMGGGGGEPYVLPTASASTKGGIKIGNGLTMEGEFLNADEQIPEYGAQEAGKILSVDNSGNLAWATVNVPVTYAKTDISNSASDVSIKVEEVV